jgi:hypothetical protein
MELLYGKYFISTFHSTTINHDVPLLSKNSTGNSVFIPCYLTNIFSLFTFIVSFSLLYESFFIVFFHDTSSAACIIYGRMRFMHRNVEGRIKLRMILGKQLVMM